MALTISKSAFEDLSKKVRESKKSKGRNENIISMEIGNTYRMRLLFYTDEVNDIKSPFLKHYTHSVQEDDGDETKRWATVTCPTTFMGQNGFKVCPVCTNNSELFNSGDANDREIYKKFKRKFYGYCLVWVVNDPTTPANNNTVKILRYGDNIDKFLNKQIFNIDPPVKKSNKGKEATAPEEVNINDDSGDIVGFDAFKLEDGYDLIITVTQNGEWPAYGCSFARKATSINADTAKLEAETKSMGFEKLIIKTPEANLEAFFKKYVLGLNNEESTSSQTSETTNTSTQTTSDSTKDETSDTSANEVEKAAEVKQSEAPKQVATAQSADIDVDAMLNDMKKDGLI